MTFIFFPNESLKLRHSQLKEYTNLISRLESVLFPPITLKNQKEAPYSHTNPHQNKITVELFLLNFTEKSIADTSGIGSVSPHNNQIIKKFETLKQPSDVSNKRVKRFLSLNLRQVSKSL